MYAYPHAAYGTYGYSPAPTYQPPVPSTWAWDPFLQPQFGFLGWSNPSSTVEAQLLAEDARSTIASNIKSERQAVFAVANLFDQAAAAGNTIASARPLLRNKASEYREAIEAGAYDPTRTRIGIGRVGWRAGAAHDKAIYDKITARYLRAIEQLRQYGAPRWIEAFDSAVVGTQARAERVQQHTWEQAAEDSVASGKKKGAWSLAILLPIALVAGAIWLAVTLAPAFTAWQTARAATATAAK